MNESPIHEEFPHAHCVLCGACISLFGHADYLLHMIDAHWDIVERIHATTGDDNARKKLTTELYAEWFPASQN